MSCNAWQANSNAEAPKLTLGQQQTSLDERQVMPWQEDDAVNAPLTVSRHSFWPFSSVLLSTTGVADTDFWFVSFEALFASAVVICCWANSSGSEGSALGAGLVVTGVLPDCDFFLLVFFFFFVDPPPDELLWALSYTNKPFLNCLSLLKRTSIHNIWVSERLFEKH